jgi:magnesium-transporting ATPase (P-type)
MQEKPVPRDESIVTKKMFTEVCISGLFITALCVCIRFALPAVLNLFGQGAMYTAEAAGDAFEAMRVYLKSAVFATFMMAITFNGFNARTEHTNVFENIGRNRNFLIVMGVIFLAQFIFVTIGGDVLSVHALTATTWLVCAVIAFLVIPIDVVRKVIMNKQQ